MLAARDGHIATHDKEILAECHKFYSSLYSSSLDRSTEDYHKTMKTFLDPRKVPVLSQADIDFLGREITEEELGEAVQGMKTGSAPPPVLMG